VTPEKSPIISRNTRLTRSAKKLAMKHAGRRPVVSPTTNPVMVSVKDIGEYCYCANLMMIVISWIDEYLIFLFYTMI